MAIKMLKMAHFLYFLLMPAKTQSQLGENIYVHLKDLIKKCYGLLDSELSLARYQPLKVKVFFIFLPTQQFCDISILNISQTVTPRLINHTIL